MLRTKQIAFLYTTIFLRLYCSLLSARLHSHLITRSAHISTWGGIFSSKALAAFKVNDQFEPCWLLYGQVSRLGTFKDLIYVVCCAPVQVGVVRPVGHKTASLYILPSMVYRRQPALCRDRNYSCSVQQQHGLCSDDDGFGFSAYH